MPDANVKITKLLLGVAVLIYDITKSAESKDSAVIISN